MDEGEDGIKTEASARIYAKTIHVASNHDELIDVEVNHVFSDGFYVSGSVKKFTANDLTAAYIECGIIETKSVLFNIIVSDSFILNCNSSKNTNFMGKRGGIWEWDVSEEEKYAIKLTNFKFDSRLELNTIGEYDITVGFIKANNVNALVKFDIHDNEEGSLLIYAPLIFKTEIETDSTISLMINEPGPIFTEQGYYSYSSIQYNITAESEFDLNGLDCSKTSDISTSRHKYKCEGMIGSSDTGPLSLDLVSLSKKKDSVKIEILNNNKEKFYSYDISKFKGVTLTAELDNVTIVSFDSLAASTSFIEIEPEDLDLYKSTNVIIRCFSYNSHPLASNKRKSEVDCRSEEVLDDDNGEGREEICSSGKLSDETEESSILEITCKDFDKENIDHSEWIHNVILIIIPPGVLKMDIIVNNAEYLVALFQGVKIQSLKISNITFSVIDYLSSENFSCMGASDQNDFNKTEKIEEEKEEAVRDICKTILTIPMVDKMDFGGTCDAIIVYSNIGNNATSINCTGDSTCRVLDGSSFDNVEKSGITCESSCIVPSIEKQSRNTEINRSRGRIIVFDLRCVSSNTVTSSMSENVRDDEEKYSSVITYFTAALENKRILCGKIGKSIVGGIFPNNDIWGYKYMIEFIGKGNNSILLQNTSVLSIPHEFGGFDSLKLIGTNQFYATYLNATKIEGEANSIIISELSSNNILLTALDGEIQVGVYPSRRGFQGAFSIYAPYAVVVDNNKISATTYKKRQLRQYL